MIDNTELARALARAIAHKNAGNDDKADFYARELIRLLQHHEILKGRSNV